VAGTGAVAGRQFSNIFQGVASSLTRFCYNRARIEPDTAIQAAQIDMKPVRISQFFANHPAGGGVVATRRGNWAIRPAWPDILVSAPVRH